MKLMWIAGAAVLGLIACERANDRPAQTTTTSSVSCDGGASSDEEIMRGAAGTSGSGLGGGSGSGMKSGSSDVCR